MNAIAYFGEKLAREYLHTHLFWKILKNNFRCLSGEVDIISSTDENIIVFTEVKTWRAYRMADLQYAIDKTKQKRISNTAICFLSKYPQYASYSCRFDAVFISVEPVKIFHFCDVFDVWEE